MGNKLDKFLLKPRSEGYEENNSIYLPESICPCQTARQFKSPTKILERERERV